MYHRQLKTFLLAADCGSFNRAAELSYVTPTAVINQVNLLESSLGTRLFERSHRGLILTSAGRSFYDDAAYMMRYWEDSVLRAQRGVCGRQVDPHRDVAADAGAGVFRTVDRDRAGASGVPSALCPL